MQIHFDKVKLNLEESSVGKLRGLTPCKRTDPKLFPPSGSINVNVLSYNYLADYNDLLMTASHSNAIKNYVCMYTTR